MIVNGMEQLVSINHVEMLQIQIYMIQTLNVKDFQKNVLSFKRNVQLKKHNVLIMKIKLHVKNILLEENNSVNGQVVLVLIWLLIVL